MRTIKIAHSPDSDDAFMFYPLAEGLLDTGDIRYVHELADIETLNRRSLAGELEVSAVSIHAYAYLADRYALLSSGASMGDGYGPRLIAQQPAAGDPRRRLRGLTVAVPGLRTSAYLALKLYQPEIAPLVVPFDRIGEAVLRGDAQVGLVIHEGQLAFAEEGFNRWKDWAPGGRRRPGSRFRSVAMWCGGIWAPRSWNRWLEISGPASNTPWLTAALRWLMPASSAGASRRKPPTSSSACTSIGGPLTTVRRDGGRYSFSSTRGPRAIHCTS